MREVGTRADGISPPEKTQDSEKENYEMMSFNDTKPGISLVVNFDIIRTYNTGSRGLCTNGRLVTPTRRTGTAVDV